MTGDRAARPRRALAWGLAAFCGLQLALAAAIELRAPWLRDPVYDRKLNQLQARLAASPDAPLVLALGSSQTFDGFDAGRMEQRLNSGSTGDPVVYNFGLPGAGPLTELLVLKRLLREGIRPELLLLEVTPGLMHGAEQIAMSGDRLALGELKIAAPFASGDRLFAAVRWLRSLTPFHTHRESLLQASLPTFAAPRRWGMTFQMFDASGWEGIPPTPSAERAVYAKVLQDAYRPLLSASHLDERSRQCLRQLVDLCRRERLRTILILMPESAAFEGLYSDAMQTAIQAEVVGLEREYQVSCVDA
ncbi:MAG TPA: hypothetical protein VHB99_16435, partial [Pirellulales bacterium]|nr:hypothetical protein [Pirellulales bacterium]